MQKTVIAVAALILLSHLACGAKVKPPPSPPPVSPRQKNGIRLVGGSGSAGRLEVQTKNAWVTGDKSGATVAWRPVCDDGSFTDATAQVMCVLLGYHYGRKYYAADVNYRPPTARNLTTPLTNITCKKTPAGSGRRALLAQTGSINIPKSVPYICKMAASTCNATGPLVGIECSHTTLPPAPPSPAAPAPRSSSIRLIGGGPRTSSVQTSQLTFGRVDVQVSAPGIADAPIWAPLCLPTGSVAARDLAALVCNQVFNWTPSDTRIVTPQLPATPQPIPQGSAYQAWVTVTGGNAKTAARVQDLLLTVSPSPCADGNIFSLTCTVEVAQ